MQRDDQRNEVLRMAQQMRKTQQNVVGEKRIRKDDRELATNETEMQNVWKSYDERLLNTELTLNREFLRNTETVSGPPLRVQKEMTRGAVKKIKKIKGKAVGLSGIVAEMLKAAGKKGIEMVTNLKYQIIKGCTIPMKNELSKMIRSETDIDNKQFGFLPGRRATDAIFNSLAVAAKVSGQEKEAHLCRLGKGLRHQGSVLSPLLFICVLETLSRVFRNGCAGEMLYADDIVLSSETMVGYWQS